MEKNRVVCLGVIFLVCTLLVSGEIYAESDLSIDKVDNNGITLEALLVNSLNNGFDFNLANEELNAQEADRDFTYSQYSSKESINYSGSRLSDDSLGRESDFIQESHEINYSVKRNVYTDTSLGGTLSTELKLAVKSEELNDFSGENTLYSAGPSIDMTYRQPLTKDSRVAEHSVLNQADNTFSLSEINYNLKVSGLIYQLIQSFFNAVKEKQLIQILKDNVDKTAKQLENAQVQARVGNLAEIEVAKLEVQLAKDENSYLDAVRNYQNSYERLMIDSGLYKKTIMDISHLPAEVKEFPMTIEEALDIAIENRKELKIYEYERLSKMIELSQANGNDDPLLTLGANYGVNRESEYSSFSDNYDKESWKLTLGFEYPFNNHGSTSSQVRKINAALNQIRINKIKKIEEINREVGEAYRDINSAIKTFHILERAAKLSEENVKIDELRFSKGVISSDDLLRTQGADLQIRVDLFNSRIDYELSIAKLYYSIGQLEGNYL